LSDTKGTAEMEFKKLFEGASLVDFDSRFSNDDECLKVLAEEKWKDGYVCRNCGNTNFCKGKTPHSRRCTRCKHEESAIAHTFLHHCKIPLNKAFKIAFLVCNNPHVSSHEISRQIGIRQMTCWKFKRKIEECLGGNEDAKS
jgi:hypothetical protein